MDQIDLLFGKIALKNKFISQDDLQTCARQSRQQGQTLGYVLLSKGFVDERKFKAIASYIEKKTGTVLEMPTLTAPAATAVAERPKPRGSSGRSKALRAASAGEIPPMAALLKRAKALGASDLHLSPEAPPKVRLYGSLDVLDGLPIMTPEVSKARVVELLTPQQTQWLHERMDFDTCLAVPGHGRFRANIMKQRRGYGGVFRVIDDKVPTLEQLGLPEVLERFTTYHQGIVLVTGAAGSGKSSTLAALVEIINKRRKDHIITLEDPIEFVYECKKSNVSQRQIEEHTQSWGNALRASLREDPDVIMVGEMRDLETMRLAVTAAETGHLVLATLHTTNTTRTIDRLLDVFPPKEQSQIRAMVSESLRGIVSQQLVPRADGKGRVAAIELLFNTPAVANLIRERQTFKLFSILQTGKRLGMRLMDDSLAELLQKGLITEDEARSRAMNPKRFGPDGDNDGYEPVEEKKSRGGRKKRGWRR